MKYFVLIPIFASTVLSACTPLRSPPSLDRISGIIDPSILKSGPARISSTNQKKLAIIYSPNFKPQIQYNEKLKVELDGKPAFAAASRAEEFTEDANIVFSSDILIGAILAPIKAKFNSTFVASDIPDAFSNGADYVGILDIRLSYDRNTNTQPNIIDATYIANASILFIDRKLEAGPDITGKASVHQFAEEGGPGGNHGDFLRITKDVRSKLIKAINVDADKKLINNGDSR